MGASAAFRVGGEAGWEAEVLQKEQTLILPQIPKLCGSELQLALLSAQSDTLSQAQGLAKLQVPKFLFWGSGTLEVGSHGGSALQTQLPGRRDERQGDLDLLRPANVDGQVCWKLLRNLAPCAVCWQLGGHSPHLPRGQAGWDITEDEGERGAEYEVNWVKTRSGWNQ